MLTLLLMVTVVFMHPVAGQETEKEQSVYADRIETLEREKSLMVTRERELLKEQVKLIDERVEEGDISREEGERLKEKAALKTAENIANYTAIIDNKIALLKRGVDVPVTDVEKEYVRIDITDWDDEWLCLWSCDHMHHHSKKYDKRTTFDIVVAAGINNAIVDGGSLDDSPYQIGGSKFFEIGWQFKTRVFQESNWLRFIYGVNFQFNGFKPEDDRYFVRQGDLTVLEEFPGNLDKSKLRMDNLVIPLYFEMGPSKKIEGGNYFRYSIRRQFRIGLGGYFGLNYSTRHKLKYKIDGDRSKDKIKSNYNTSNTIYGLAGYIGFGDLTFYTRYELNPIFKDPNPEQHNIAFGLRWEL